MTWDGITPENHTSFAGRQNRETETEKKMKQKNETWVKANVTKENCSKGKKKEEWFRDEQCKIRIWSLKGYKTTSIDKCGFSVKRVTTH